LETGQIHLKENDILFFLHIPKTAGTALFRSLVRLVGDQNVLSLPDHVLSIAYGPTYSPSQIDGLGIKIVRQHKTYDFIQEFPRAPYTITMLRSPMARIISYYRYVKTVPSHSLHNRVVNENIGLDEFLDIAPMFDTYNSQTWRLCGSEIFMKEAFSDEDKVAIAKTHLEQVAYFGLQEQFDLSLKLLSWKFNWPSLKWDVVNKSKAKFTDHELTQTVKDKIEEMNHLDQQLYSYAEELFERRVNASKLEKQTL